MSKRAVKISKQYFERFKKAFVEWQYKLGLTQYRIDFFHEYLEKSYSEIYVNEEEKTVRVSLTKKLNSDSVKSDEGPEKHAQHEALHLLLHRLLWLGQSRYIERTDLHEEWETLVRRLQKVLE